MFVCVHAHMSAGSHACLYTLMGSQTSSSCVSPRVPSTFWGILIVYLFVFSMCLFGRYCVCVLTCSTVYIWRSGANSIMSVLGVELKLSGWAAEPLYLLNRFPRPSTCFMTDLAPIAWDSPNRLSLPSGDSEYKCVPPCPAFSMRLRVELRSSCLCGRHFIDGRKLLWNVGSI